MFFVQMRSAKAGTPVSQQSSHDTDTCCSSLLQQNQWQAGPRSLNVAVSRARLPQRPCGHEYMHDSPAADRLCGSRSPSEHPRGLDDCDSASEGSPAKDCIADISPKSGAFQ